MEVIPGPSAFLAALSVSGLPINHFLYLGFLPLKKGRQTLMKTFAQTEHTIVFYESVHRIEKTLIELSEIFASQPDRAVVICRELTKMHEEILYTTVGGGASRGDAHNNNTRASCSDALSDVAKTITKKGEFVIVIGAYNL